MGNAAYEERRNQQAERQLAEERRARARERREVLAEDFVELAMLSLTAFFQGRTSLIIREPDKPEKEIWFTPVSTPLSQSE